MGPVVRAAAEVLAAGHVLGGRYRLDRLVAPELAPLGSGLWQATDLVLERPVAVRVVVDGDDQVRAALLMAAARASTARDPRIAATYDAAEHDPGDGSGPVAYLVREWVDGQPLRRQLADGGLDPQRLHTVLRHAADAVAALHADGGWHGRVHPDNLLVLTGDRVRLTDPGTAVALAAVGRPAFGRVGNRDGPPALPPAIVADLALGARPLDPGGDPALLRRCQRYDTCDLGRVLYAAGTGTWVGGPWRGMPAAPGDGERPHAPRQVRAAVPRDLDAVVRRILLPSPGRPAGLQDAAAVAASLNRLDAEPVQPVTLTTRSRRPRPVVVVGLLVALLLVLAAVGFALGKRLGRVPGTNNGLPVLTPAPSVSGAATPSAVIRLSAVTAFDPPPGDGQENDDQIPLAYDGSTATAWQTQRYGSAALGGLKPGVGLLVDLGSVRKVSTVQVALVGTGTTVALLAVDTRSPALAGFPQLAQQQNAGTTVTLTANAAHRYWVVWLTMLPRVSGGYRGGIAELVFRS